MRAGSAGFQKLERISAERFLQACVKAGVKRIVYLSGLGRREKVGRHLLSRISTGEILSSQPEKIRTIWFRAGAIIGAGSGSFEILYHLVKRLPVMVTPKWVRLKTQPVAVSDVLKYLVRTKDVNCQGNSLVVDIGAETMTVEQMLLQIAEVLGLRRRIIPLPAWIAEISAYWLLLFTPTPYTVAREFIETLKAEPVCQNNNVEKYFPEIRLLTFKDAIKQAIDEIEQNQVISRWCDSSAAEVCDTVGQDYIATAVLTDRKQYRFENVSEAQVFASILSIGSEKGWFKYNILWEIRGLIDKLIGGYGISRGRRDGQQLRTGDCLDFWKVVDLKTNQRLLLAAQMKVPGRAWLEFVIEPGGAADSNSLFSARWILGKAVLVFDASLSLFYFQGYGREYYQKGFIHIVLRLHLSGLSGYMLSQV